MSLFLRSIVVLALALSADVARAQEPVRVIRALGPQHYDPPPEEPQEPLPRTCNERDIAWSTKPVTMEFSPSDVPAIQWGIQSSTISEAGECRFKTIVIEPVTKPAWLPCVHVTITAADPLLGHYAQVDSETCGNASGRGFVGWIGPGEGRIPEWATVDMIKVRAKVIPRPDPIPGSEWLLDPVARAAARPSGPKPATVPCEEWMTIESSVNRTGPGAASYSHVWAILTDEAHEPGKYIERPSHLLVRNSSSRYPIYWRSTGAGVNTIPGYELKPGEEALTYLAIYTSGGEPIISIDFELKYCADL